MTNQQGAPEALPPAFIHYPPKKPELARVDFLPMATREERGNGWVTVALVEAQQPAAHVQKPAEIEHVAGDVSKNGAESNMAQQPAPSAAAEPDMFWDYDDPERFGHEIEDVISEYAPGDIVKIDCAKRMPTIRVRVVADGDDLTYEVIGAPQPSPTPQADMAIRAALASVAQAPQQEAVALLPEHLTLAVDQWFAQNTGLGGCSDKDVAQLAAIFYGVTYDGGRESVDDALAVVESFGPGIEGLNDTYARQVILAQEVLRLHGECMRSMDSHQTTRNALRAALDHIDMNALRISHCKDAAAIDAAQAYRQVAPAMPPGWVPCTIEFDGSGPEEVAYGPQILMDRLGKWLRKYFDHVVASKAQPSPTPQADSQPAPVLDSLALMKVVMRADEALAGRCTRGTTNWAAAIGKAVQDAVLAARAPEDSVLEDAARLDWLELAGPTSICRVIDRPHDGEVEVATDDVTGYGKTLREALDAARKQGANHD